MLIIGHRGASGTVPENTLKSFEKAVQAGAKMIELDVHQCAGGELVVIHDEKINRTTNGKGLVSEKTLTELKNVDAGQGEKIPLLSEVLDLVDHRAMINIELKGAGVAVPVYELLKKYKKDFGWNTDDFCISSFDHQQLSDFRNVDRKTKIGILYPRYPHGFVKLADELQPFSINLSLRTVKPGLVKEIHALGLEVWVYTVNELFDLERLKTLGIDAVFTNYPGKFLHHN